MSQQSSLLLGQAPPRPPAAPEEPPDIPALYREVAESVRDYFRACRDPAAEPIMAAIKRMRVAIIALHKAENPG
jgi:hypothetical protein